MYKDGDKMYITKFSDIFSNPLINISIISWFTAQMLKTIGYCIKYRTFNSSRLSGSGGMPSSHSAVVCSLALTAYYMYGIESPAFAISFILAVIVMYDATGVRMQAGKNADAINTLVDYISQNFKEHRRLDEMIPELNTLVGHRLIEVICGALLGIFIAVIAHFIMT